MKAKKILLLLGMVVAVFALVIAEIGAQETIKIGALFGLTGEMAAIANPAAQGAKLAAEQINAQGGVLNKQIELILYDTQSNTEIAANAMNRLINIDKVVAAFGLTDGKYVTAAVPLAQRAGIPFLITTATTPTLTQIGNYVFMTPFADDFQGKMLAKFAYERLGARKAVCLYDAGIGYSTELFKYFSQAFKELTGDENAIVFVDTYHAGDTDFSAQLTRIRSKQKEADIFAFFPDPAEAGLIVRQAGELGIKLQYLAGDGADSPDLVSIAGEYAEGMIMSTHFSPFNPENPRAKKFVEDFKAKYGTEPGAFAALGYDSMLLTADAIARAGTTDPKAIRDALEATDGFMGVTGEYRFDERRIPAKPVIFVQVKNGVHTFLEAFKP